MKNFKLNAYIRQIKTVINRFGEYFDVETEDKDTGFFEDGIYISGTIKTRKILMVIQPLQEKDIKDLDEGQREEDARKFWCIDLITNKDKVVYNNEKYTINGIKSYFSHYEGMIFRAGVQDVD